MTGGFQVVTPEMYYNAQNLDRSHVFQAKAEPAGLSERSRHTHSGVLGTLPGVLPILTRDSAQTCPSWRRRERIASMCGDIAANHSGSPPHASSRNSLTAAISHESHAVVRFNSPDVDIGESIYRFHPSSRCLGTSTYCSASFSRDHAGAFWISSGSSSPAGGHGSCILEATSGSVPTRIDHIVKDIPSFVNRVAMGHFRARR